MASAKRPVNASPSPGDVPAKKKGNLTKTRPAGPKHVGQHWKGKGKVVVKKKGGFQRLGYERLRHMYSLGIPYRFEQLQGRTPEGFLEETEEHFRLYPPSKTDQPAEIIDDTLLDYREWMEPMYPKGQAYWDYCRDKWLEKVSRLGAICAPVGSLYTFSTITGDSLRNGGPAFFLVYFIFVFIFVVPFIYMELIMGQFYRAGLAKTIRRACPLFRALAYLLLLSSVVDYVLTVMELCYILNYSFVSLSLIFPWRECGSNIKHWDWFTDHCKVDAHVDDEEFNIPATEFFRHGILWDHRNFTERLDRGRTLVDLVYITLSPFPNPWLVPGLIVLVCIFYFILKLPCLRFGRVLFYLFFTAITLVGIYLVVSCYHSIYQENKLLEWLASGENFKFLANKNTWITAIKHAIASSGIGTGIYINIGSHNEFVNDDLKSSAIVAGVSGFVLHGAIAATMLYVHHFLDTTLSREKEDAGPYKKHDIFELIPHYFARHPKVNVSWVLFNTLFCALTLFGILHAICTLFSIKEHFIGLNKEYYEPYRFFFNFWEKHPSLRQQRYSERTRGLARRSRLFLKFLGVTSLLILGMFSLGVRGFLYKNLAAALWYKYGLILIVLVEIFVIFFFVGVRGLNDYVRKMTTWQVTLGVRFAWKVFIPLIPLMYIVQSHDWFSDRVVFEDQSLNEIEYYCGYVLLFLPFGLLFFGATLQVRSSHVKGFHKKLVLEIHPEHEHQAMINGVKPAARLHWMHYMFVPKGIGRGACSAGILEPHSVKLHWPSVERALMSIAWFGLKVKLLNQCLKRSSLTYAKEEDIQKFQLLPAVQLRTKAEKTTDQPEYLKSKKLKRIHVLKKKTHHQRRNKWQAEKMEVSRSTQKVANTLQGVQAEDSKKVHEEESSSSPSDDDTWKVDFAARQENKGGQMRVEDSESFDDEESDDWEAVTGHLDRHSDGDEDGELMEDRPLKEIEKVEKIGDVSAGDTLHTLGFADPSTTEDGEFEDLIDDESGESIPGKGEGDDDSGESDETDTEELQIESEDTFPGGSSPEGEQPVDDEDAELLKRNTITFAVEDFPGPKLEALSDEDKSESSGGSWSSTSRSSRSGSSFSGSSVSSKDDHLPTQPSKATAPTKPTPFNFRTRTKKKKSIREAIMMANTAETLQGFLETTIKKNKVKSERKKAEI